MAEVNPANPVEARDLGSIRGISDADRRDRGPSWRRIHGEDVLALCDEVEAARAALAALPSPPPDPDFTEIASRLPNLTPEDNAAVTEMLRQTYEALAHPSPPPDRVPEGEVIWEGERWRIQWAGHVEVEGSNLAPIGQLTTINDRGVTANAYWQRVYRLVPVFQDPEA